MKIVLYQRWEEVEQRLSGHWNLLLKRSASDTFFLTWEWISSWWNAYGKDMTPFVLAAWDGERLAGLAPFCRENVRKAGSAWNYLRFIGDGSHDSDYLDCFAPKGQEEEFIDSMLSYLRQHAGSWDCLELHGPVASSPLMAALTSRLQAIKGDDATGPCSS